MLVGAKVCDLAEDLLWFVCGLYMGILKSSLSVSYIIITIEHNYSGFMCDSY